MSAAPHFDQPTVRWAATGALTGGVAVLASIGALVTITGAEPELMAVAGLAAAFGGGGLGAMLGAVLASVREPVPALVSEREHSGAVRRRVVSS